MQSLTAAGRNLHVQFVATIISHTDTKLHVCKTELFHITILTKFTSNLQTNCMTFGKFTEAVLLTKVHDDSTVSTCC